MFAYLWKRWLRILLIAIGGAFLGVVASIVIPKKYVASTSFILEGAGSGAQGKLALIQLAMSFGGSGGGVVDESQLLQILSSRHVLSNALLNKAIVKEKEDLLANHMIDLYGLNDGREPGPFYFEHTKLEDFTYSEDSTMMILTALAGVKLLETMNTEEGIVYVNVLSHSDEFSKYFNDALIRETEEFYVSKKIEQDQKTQHIIQKRLDSVLTELRLVEDQLAKIKDSHTASFMAQARKEEVQLTREMQVLNVMYAELVKNNEIAQFNLLSNTPLIQIIDRPIFPLKKDGLNIIKGSLLGGIIAFSLTILFYISRLLYQTAMKDDDEIKEEGN